MTPSLRKLALTAHIIFSVGWLGALAGFLVLNLTGLASHDPDVIHGAYFSMNLIARLVIVPLSLAALATGLVQAWGTEWGLFRHYWIIAKLLLTVVATAVLLAKLPLIGFAVQRAAATTGPDSELRAAGLQLLVHAAGGLLVLLAITILSVFKPWGRTRYGRNNPRETAGGTGAPCPTDPAVDNKTTGTGLLTGRRIFLVFIGVLLVGHLFLHLAGGDFGPHGH